MDADNAELVVAHTSLGVDELAKMIPARIAFATARRIADLLPWNWKATANGTLKPSGLPPGPGRLGIFRAWALVLPCEHVAESRFITVGVQIMIRKFSLATALAAAIALPALAEDKKTIDPGGSTGPTDTMTDQVPQMKRDAEAIKEAGLDQAATVDEGGGGSCSIDAPRRCRIGSVGFKVES
jgi:hypothetical protein